jgi:hypothetical protein
VALDVLLLDYSGWTHKDYGSACAGISQVVVLGDLLTVESRVEKQRHRSGSQLPSSPANHSKVRFPASSLTTYLSERHDSSRIHGWTKTTELMLSSLSNLSDLLSYNVHAIYQSDHNPCTPIC